MARKIGLALGSGAARGWAHIGIIEALEKHGIKIDMVAGCSIGAYVGAAYCANKLPELKEWVCSLTEWQVAALLGMGWHKGGIMSGEKVFQKLATELTLENIEDFDKPLGVVATDLHRGRETWFKDGNTINAVRASCSIPGLFPPHYYQDKWLVDGAVTNPVPVTLCHNMGADIVIAVNLATDFDVNSREENIKNQQMNDDRLSQFIEKSASMFGKWFDFNKDKTKITTPSMFGTMNSSLNIMQDWLTRSKLAAEPPNLLLSPKLGHIGIMEFHRAQECIQIGRESVERMIEQIKYELQ